MQFEVVYLTCVVTFYDVIAGHLQEHLDSFLHIPRLESQENAQMLSPALHAPESFGRPDRSPRQM